MFAVLAVILAVTPATSSSAVDARLATGLDAIQLRDLRADLTFLGSDPINDIRKTRDVKRVMRGGRIYTVTDLIKK